MGRQVHRRLLVNAILDVKAVSRGRGSAIGNRPSTRSHSCGPPRAPFRGIVSSQQLLIVQVVALAYPKWNRPPGKDPHDAVNRKSGGSHPLARISGSANIDADCGSRNSGREGVSRVVFRTKMAPKDDATSTHPKPGTGQGRALYAGRRSRQWIRGIARCGRAARRPQESAKNCLIPCATSV